MENVERNQANRGAILVAEDTANFLTHAIFVPYVVFAILDLQIHTNTPREFIVLSVYGWIMLSLFAVSAFYHLSCLLAGLYPDGRWYSNSRSFFRIVDRSLIHLFIAACYTPWLMLHQNGPFAEHVCHAVWICAILSIVAQNAPFTFNLAQTEAFVIGSYLMLGVLPGTFICAFATDLDGIVSLAKGGALYIAGLIFYFAEGRLPFAHAIWHVFVNSGAFVHYRALNDFLIRERILATQQNSSWLYWLTSHIHPDN